VIETTRVGRLSVAVDDRLATALRAGTDWLRRLLAPETGRPPAVLPMHLLDDVDASGELRRRSEKFELERQLDSARLRRGWTDAPW
jgi:hypothetical protein